MGGFICHDFPIPANVDETKSSLRVERIGGQLATGAIEEDVGKDFRGDAKDDELGVELSTKSNNRVLERFDLGRV